MGSDLLHLELSSLQLISRPVRHCCCRLCVDFAEDSVAEEKATMLASKLGLMPSLFIKSTRLSFLFAMMLGAVLQITNVFGSRSCMISPYLSLL